MRKRGPGSVFSALGWACLVLAVALNVVGIGAKNTPASYVGAAFGAAAALLFARHMKNS